MLTLHFDKVIASFQKSINRIEVASNIPMFKKLRGLVSLNALDYMVKEFHRSTSYVGHDKGRCGCTIRKTHLLPCACEIGVYHISGSFIPLDVVDDHWKQLSFDSLDQQFSQQQSEGCDISYQMEMIWARFNGMTEDEKFVLKKQLNEIAFPATSSMVPPPFKLKTKGAPKKKKQKLYDVKRDLSGWEHVDEKLQITQQSGPSTSKKTSQRPSNSSKGASRKLTKKANTFVNLHDVPLHLQCYVENIVDVMEDGNCGFRAIGVGLNLGDESWPLIRQDLLQESIDREALYSHIYGKKQLDVLREAFTIDSYGFQPMEKWLSLPDMGFFVATKYNVALVQLSLRGSFTFLPLRGHYSTSKIKTIFILNIRDVHWMHVSMSSSCPLPPIVPLWPHNRSDEAASWLDAYRGRFALWKTLCPAVIQSDAPICVDLGDDTDDLSGLLS